MTENEGPEQTYAIAHVHNRDAYALCQLRFLTISDILRCFWWARPLRPHYRWGRGDLGNSSQPPFAPLCDIPSGCCSFAGPWTVTHSSLRMLRRVAAFYRPLRPVLLLVSRSPVVGVLGLC